MNFSDIPKYTLPGNYKVDIGWKNLLREISRYKENYGLDMFPDFQRGHVWTAEQQNAYVEFKLAGGGTYDIINLNCVGWMNDFKGPFVIVDGLQRITAALLFLNNILPAYGYYYREFEGSLRSFEPSFQFCINNLKTRKEVLKWYLEINSGGTPHAKEEIERVKELLEKESNG